MIANHISREKALLLLLFSLNLEYTYRQNM